MADTVNDYPEFPNFLARENSKPKDEVPMRKVSEKVMASDEAAGAAEDEAPAPAKRPRKAAKANGTKAAAAPVKAAGKPKAKAATPAKVKAKKAATAPRKAPVRDPAKLDGFGFRLGSLKSQAAAMYSKGKGATLGEVKEALESSQFNLLTQLEGDGFTIKKTPEDGAGPRKVTRYKIMPK